MSSVNWVRQPWMSPIASHLPCGGFVCTGFIFLFYPLLPSCEGQERVVCAPRSRHTDAVSRKAAMFGASMRIKLIGNPVSGGDARSRIQAALGTLRDLGGEVDL